MFFYGTKVMKTDEASSITTQALVSPRCSTQSFTVLAIEIESLISFLWSDT